MMTLRSSVDFYPVASLNTYAEKTKVNFMVDDISSAITDIMGAEAVDVMIAYIDEYYGTTEEKAKIIKDICDKYKDDNNYVICTEAYVSKVEFPEDRYYDPNDDDPYVESEPAGKEPVPYGEVLDRESKMLQELGFININDIIQYQNKVAYIYPNELGKKILDYWHNDKQQEEAITIH